MTRTRWGGSLLEEARLHGAVKLITVQPHSVAVQSAPGGEPRVERFTPSLTEADLVVRVIEHVAAPAGGVSLAEAKVVVSGGRGVGSTEGFSIVEEFAALLGGAVGCSRVVTSAGLAAAHRSGRSDGHEDLAGSLHPVRDQRRHAAHRGLPRRQADARHQRRPGGTDLRERRLRRDRRSARDPARDLGGDQEGDGDITTLAGAVALAALVAFSGVLFTRRAWLLWRLVRIGKPVERFDDLPQRLRAEAEIVLGQRKLFQRLVPGASARRHLLGVPRSPADDP